MRPALLPVKLAQNAHLFNPSQGTATLCDKPPH
jgi:hypothetical protein